jgi:hypothetical protein
MRLDCTVPPPNAWRHVADAVTNVTAVPEHSWYGETSRRFGSKRHMSTATCRSTCNNGTRMSLRSASLSEALQLFPSLLIAE